jgi:hypothetical protein
MDDFYRIPDYPTRLTGTSVLTRMLDGLGFRFYWSTEGLRPEDYSFRPGADTRSIEELVKHVWGLLNWVSSSALDKPYKRLDSAEAVREQVLEIVYDLRSALIAMNDEDLQKLRIRDKPFWHIINGPVSDTLTHVGQINSFRRLAGNPVAGANVFTGEPPNKTA